MSRRSAGVGRNGVGHEVRAGRDADDVMARAKAGDVVVLDRMDLEPELARGLIAAGVHAVVNAQPALSGRFPSSGSLLLVRAGVILIDSAGAEVAEVRDGERVRVLDNRILRGDRVLVEGRRRSDSDLMAELEQVRGAGGAMVRAEALVADSVGLLRVSPGIVDGSAAAPALVHVIDARACIVASHDVGAGDRAWLKRAGSSGTWAVIAASETAALALATLGVVPDAVILPSDGAIAPAMASDDAAATAEGAVRVPGVMAGPDLDVAVVTALIAGASAVVPLGPSGHDLIEALDQPRAASAAAAVVRLVGAGRVVHGETVRSLGRASPLVVGRGADRTRRWGQAWTIPALVAALALAVGVAVGAGAGARVLGSDAALIQARAVQEAFQERAAALGTELSQAEAVAANLQEDIVQGRLDDQRLVLVVGPGVPDDVVAGTRAVVEQAGGTWTGTVTASDAYVDPDRATSLDDIALRLAPTEAEFPASGTPGARRDAALAASIVRADADGAASSSSAGYLAALEQVEAIVVEGTPQNRAGLAVLLVPAGKPGATSEALTSLAKALGATVGVVVGTPGGASTSATVSVLRATQPPPRQVSTVDGVARAWGRIAVVDAAESAFKATFGAFGPEAALAEAAQGGSTPTPRATG